MEGLTLGSLEGAVRKARERAIARIRAGSSADEFVEIAKVGSSTVYVAASQDYPPGPRSAHANANDCMVHILEGAMSLELAGDSTRHTLGVGALAKVPAGAMHTVLFDEMTIYLAVVDTPEDACRDQAGSPGVPLRMDEGVHHGGALFRIDYHVKPSREVIERVVSIARSLTGLWFTENVPGDAERDLLFQHALTYTVGDEIVGFLVFTSIDGLLQIMLMGTAPALHGKGIGSRLVSALKALAASLGCEALRVLTVPPEANERYRGTVAFYEKNGFRTVRVYRDLWEHGAIEMECPVPVVPRRCSSSR